VKGAAKDVATEVATRAVLTYVAVKSIIGVITNTQPGPPPSTQAEPQSPTTTPPTPIVQPMPPPPPVEARHRKGGRESTREKHERLRPGRPTTKNRENPEWRPR